MNGWLSVVLNTLSSMSNFDTIFEWEDWMFLTTVGGAFLYSFWIALSRNSLYFVGAILWKLVDLSPFTSISLPFFISFISFESLFWKLLYLFLNLISLSKFARPSSNSFNSLVKGAGVRDLKFVIFFLLGGRFWVEEEVGLPSHTSSGCSMELISFCSVTFLLGMGMFFRGYMMTKFRCRFFLAN